MSEVFERELAVFSAVRRLPPVERAPYLDQTCAGEAALRQRVEELLRAGEDAEGFLQKPAPGAQRPEGASAASTPRLNEGPPGEKAGDRIGHYKLLQQIGEGGCGLVYMAEQEEPVRRRVALKVIKLGMDTKSVIARFEAERQALAMMDHANIAKVFEAGATETGRPYFVMELVKGIKITDYCDEHSLSTKERLELFIQVCHAVQHAHQKGIIHRDLKPSNILVASNDGVPVAKVIDFGIAKATQGRLTDHTLFTAFEQFIGTPAYMSPEQAELTMEDVDTRTDIYSLGVLFYELLIGRTPFDTQELLASGLDTMRRTIREREPQRPSTKLSTMLDEERTRTANRRRTDAPRLIHLLRGDLDWIVMKCLEKDRARRYETASGVANDVQRHLNCEPVVARPPSRLYEFQKTVRRHKLGFAAAAAVITVLSAGVVMSTWEAMRAARAQRAMTEKIFDSYLAQARARRHDEREGRRFESLEAVAKAAAIHSSLELRNEAIACLALTDVRFADARESPDLEGEYWGAGLKLRAFRQFDGTVRVHRVSDDREVAVLPAVGAEAPGPYGFSADGRYLLIGSLSGPSTVWDLNQQQPAQPSITGIAGSLCADFSKDGKKLVFIGQDGQLRQFGLDPIRSLSSLALDRRYRSLRLRPQGDWIAVCERDKANIEVLDLRDGAVLKTFSHPSPVSGYVWNGDGTLLAVGCVNGNISIWNVMTEKEKQVQGHQDNVWGLGFSHSGQFLASSGWDGYFRLQDLASGHTLLTAAGMSHQVLFSEDDRKIGYVRRGHKTGSMEVVASSIFRRLSCRASVLRGPLTADVSPDGRLVAAAFSDGVRIWTDRQTREPFLLPAGSCFSAIFTPDGTNLITCGQGGLAFWPIHHTSGTTTDELHIGPRQMIRDGLEFNYAALSSDGRWVAAANFPAGAVSIYEVHAPANRFRLTNHPNIQSVSISPDGRWVAAGNWKRSGVKVWEFESRRVVCELPTPSSAWVTFSPDNHWLAVGGESYDLWETRTWKRKFTIGRTRPEGSVALAFSPDARTLAIGIEPGVVRLIAPDTGELLADLEGPDGSVIPHLRFSPDGSELFASEIDQQVQVWDLRKLRAELSKLNLDWSAPPFPPEPTGPKPALKPLRISLVETVSPQQSAFSGGAP
jgi:serine/threonine protein kinase/WD40 repeat protein